MATFPNSGRVALAESVAARPLHLAWGSGDGAWTSTVPAEDANAAGLIAEIGRRTVTSVGYVVPDAAGTIVLPSGAYSASATPTKHLLLTTTFDFLDAQSGVIREIGIFVGGTVIAGLPGTQRYFTPSQVATPGRLIHLEHFAPVFRTPAIAESFQVVITF